jgi:hypothetical protein
MVIAAALLLAQLAAQSQKLPSDLKLSTPLVELAHAVPQHSGAVYTAGKGVPGFSVSELPKSLRDRISAGDMQVNDRGEVQVYIVVDQVHSAVLKHLRRAGVTVERLDARERVVQALCP